MKLRLLTIAFILLCMAAKAQTNVTPARLKAAEDVLKAMGADSMLKKTTTAALTQASSQVPADKRTKFLEIMNSFVSKYMQWGLLKDQMAALYAQNFTEKELRDLVAFYNTPTGRKFVQVQPLLTQKGMEIGQQMVQAHQAELQQMLQDAFKE